MQRTLPFFGDVMVTDKHVISVQNDVGTSYNAYIQVQNELVRLFTMSCVMSLAQSQFGKSFERMF